MKLPNLTGKRVWITWHDACDIQQTWVKDHELDADQEPVEVISSGWVARHGKKTIKLAGDRHQRSVETSPTWGRVTEIPVGMIVAVEYEKKGEK